MIKKNTRRRPFIPPLFFSLLIVFFIFTNCASRGVTTAEEYFSIGMAYFEMGQSTKDQNTRTRYFTEAEKWLNRAKSIDKTKSASEYNLGRIAFETGRYQDAAKYFEGILKRDSENIMALTAASYTRIKTGELEKAEQHYQKLLSLVPESADEGYNYALILYTMEKYEKAEQVLEGYRFAILDNSDTLLLYARIQKAQDKIEAIDSYAKWLTDNSNAKVKFEYGEILEKHEFYARALEEYRSILPDESTGEKTEENANVSNKDVRFAIARLLLIADSESEDGIKELNTARAEGFDDIEALEELLKDIRISNENLLQIRSIINDLQRAAEIAKSQADAAAAAATATESEIPSSVENIEGSADSPDE